MSHEFIEVSISERITTITIRRPEVMNALHPYALMEMDAAFNAFHEDDEQWLAILTGSGDRAFCAGNDLKFQADHGAERVRELRSGLVGGFGGLTRRVGCYKPIIAAVNGLALGGGFELALACDIIVAVDHATFGLPEPRVGLMAAAGGVHRLPRQIPWHAAMAVILAGKRLGAAEALSFGLINEIVPSAMSEEGAESDGSKPKDGEEKGSALMIAARRWADDILAGAPLSVRASKEAVVMGSAMPLEHAIDSVFPVARRMYESQDLVEGPRAFAEKRRPHWQGR
ncbi:enoyl-CoA hydratase-related protein [Thioalkalivibrio sp. HK1]|uniref:enoyl-CoA hydratase-related protein n=1 Tax=Thioalkalivibrio sp. HK1 TaxID=1469245 RepID=UPI00047059AA|nr:enoyl-CoA hydratase-related protein [Thioalkalivibrio sp. HK1]